jgi:hypothetical protein
MLERSKTMINTNPVREAVKALRTVKNEIMPSLAQVRKAARLCKRAGLMASYRDMVKFEEVILIEWELAM